LVARLSADGGHLNARIDRWWQLRYSPAHAITLQDAEEGLLERLTAAVRLRLAADVPVGALLSGGTDSSVVVALMSRLSGTRVKTFAIGFNEREYNELPFARAVAQRYSTEHHEFIVRPDLLNILPTLVRHYGEPYADSSAIPTYYVAQMARQHVTVVLNGDGGDECLAGYERYLGSVIAERYRVLPAVFRSQVIERGARLLPSGGSRVSLTGQIRRFVEVAAWPWSRRYVRWMTYFDHARRRELYTGSGLQEMAGSRAESWLTALVSGYSEAYGRTVNALLATDVESYLPNDLLVKMDIASMANSLEARSPFLDHEVVEYCATLPSRYKIRGRTLKYLLRRIALRVVPSGNVRRRKMGFGVPVGDWMRTESRPFLEDTLLGPQARRRGLFQPAAIQRLLNEHHSRVQDHGQRLWALLWLELWFREFID
jgi:asparagine synthase (glutamine-hydrolysing)